METKAEHAVEGDGAQRQQMCETEISFSEMYEQKRLTQGSKSLSFFFNEVYFWII